MKHIDNVNWENSQFENKKFERIFVDPLEFFERNGKYAVPKGQKKRFRHRNVVAKASHVATDETHLDKQARQLVDIIGVLTTNDKSPKTKDIRSKSKIITIIDDGDQQQDKDGIDAIMHQSIINKKLLPPTNLHPQSINIFSYQNRFSINDVQQSNLSKNSSDVMKLPILANNNSNKSQYKQQNKNDIQESLSYLSSQVDTSRTNPKHIRKHKSQHNRSNNQLYYGSINRTIDYRKQLLVRNNQQLFQKLLLPNLNNRHKTISQDQAQQLIQDKKQIKLSGVSVIPSLRVNPHNDKPPHIQITTTRPRQINLIPSQMIYKNPVSSVKKSVYQLLVKKHHSYY